MTAVRIQTGATEPIEALIVNAAGVPLTSLADIEVKIRRLSDGFYFDWSDNTFKVLGSVVTLTTPLAEVSAAGSPGEYQLSSPPHTAGFTTSAIVNPSPNDTYRVTVIQTVATTAANVPQIGEIKEGQFVDNIDALISSRSSHSAVDVDAVLTAAHGTGAWTSALDIAFKQTYAYDPTGDVLIGNVWAERFSGASIAVTAVTSRWYDEDGTLQFTFTTAGPDAQGVFKVSRSAPGLVRGKSFYVESDYTITGVGTITARKGNFTVG